MFVVTVASIDSGFLKDTSKLAARATSSAINKTMKTVRSRVATEAAEQLKIKKGVVMKRLFLRGAQRTRLESTLSLFGAKVPLASFGARSVNVRGASGKKRKGVTVVVRGVRQRVDGGFLATMPNGKVGVFMRKGEDRLPIKELFSNDLKAMLTAGTGFLSSIQGFARETLKKNYIREKQYFLTRR